MKGTGSRDQQKLSFGNVRMFFFDVRLTWIIFLSISQYVGSSFCGTSFIL